MFGQVLLAAYVNSQRFIVKKYFWGKIFTRSIVSNYHRLKFNLDLLYFLSLKISKLNFKLYKVFNF